jgi:hypothetical protein
MLQTKRAVLGAIRKHRLDDIAAHSPFVLQQMMATGMPAPSGSVSYLPIHAVQG